MDRTKYGKNSKRSFGNIIYWTAGALLILTMISTWLLSGLFAKYVNTEAYSESARVAAGGVIDLWEHEATLNNGIYELDENVKIKKNTYNKVIPGVDIAKDPFVSIDLQNAEVSYELYVQVTESKEFPATVTYSLTNDWELVNASKGIYKYKSILNKGFSGDIKILKDDRLYVSEHYVGNNKEFSLAFNSWLKQAD